MSRPSVHEREHSCHRSPGLQACAEHQGATSIPASDTHKPNDGPGPANEEVRAGNVAPESTGPRGALPAAFQRSRAVDTIQAAARHGAAADAGTNEPTLGDITEPGGVSATWNSVAAAALRYAEGFHVPPAVQALQARGQATQDARAAACARLLARLNPEQLSAVLADIEAPLLVAAGPGSGKTSAMIARVAYLAMQVLSPQTVLFLKERLLCRCTIDAVLHSASLKGCPHCLLRHQLQSAVPLYAESTIRACIAYGPAAHHSRCIAGRAAGGDSGGDVHDGRCCRVWQARCCGAWSGRSRHDSVNVSLHQLVDSQRAQVRMSVRSINLEACIVEGHTCRKRAVLLCTEVVKICAECPAAF